MNYVGTPEWKTVKESVLKDNVKWTLHSDDPVLLFSSPFLGKKGITFLAEPGDHIKVSRKDGNTVFSGRGAAKFDLLLGIEMLKNRIVRPSKSFLFSVNSLEDYFKWNTYFSRQLDVVLPLIESYRNRISAFAYERIKANTIITIESDRLDLFWTNRETLKGSGITGPDLAEIYDSTFYSAPAKWARSLSTNLDRAAYLYTFNRAEVFRRFLFNIDHDSLNTDAKRRLLYYSEAKEKYKGVVREKLLAFLLTYETIKEIGFVPETETLLADYYLQPGYPAFKKWVRQYERKARSLRDGMPAPDFSLVDMKGHLFTKDRVAGKIAIMDFWFTGCKGCVQMTRAMKKVEETFEGDSNVVFISVSADKRVDRWTKSLAEGKYTTGKGINLYTAGLGTEHPMLKAFNVTSFPKLYLLDSWGNIAANPLPDPRDDGGQRLVQLIRRQLLLAHDGPYVFHRSDTVTSYSISPSGIVSEVLEPSSRRILSVNGDQVGRAFNVPIKMAHEVQRASYPRADKLFVVSDIEGDFSAFRKLLQHNGVIDEDYNWSFGDGHLVCVGDFFDRGQQVTEVLWLIYSLEEKAEAAGGHVHFILGNHEIMNLSGDFRYVEEKYQKNAKRLGLSYPDLYGKNTELGKWLRTKNIVEKIGDVLFVHAGISDAVNRLPLSIDQINQRARFYYDYNKDSLKGNMLEKDIAIIFDPRTSPFWYRLYYQDRWKKILTNGDTIYKAELKQVERTLDKFDVNRIVTGHTIVADTISMHYNGKVINIDTDHAEGKSEALLIENAGYFRVNAQGDKRLLFHKEELFTQAGLQE